MLALSTQLWQIGFAASCYIAIIFAGCWLKRWRPIAVGVTGLLVFTITYLACWAQLGDVKTMNPHPFHIEQMRLELLSQSLTEDAMVRGQFATSLGELKGLESQSRQDSWRHPYHYQRTDTDFELAALGRDGELGGVGLDADIYLGDDLELPKFRLTLQQFLFEARGSGALFLAAVVSSALTASIWFVPGGKDTPRNLIGSLTITIIAGSLVAGVLAVLYVALAQPSGH
jgi:hypothetical protein